jgi:hypothetical protein
MKYVRTLLGVLFLLILLWLFYDYSINHRILVIGFDKEPERSRSVPVWQIALSAVAMILGVLFGSIYDRLKSRKGKVRLGKEVSALLSSSHFLKALLAAPIIFAGVYAASRSQPDVLVAFLFAFQNGFFCDAILRDSEPKKK